MPWGSLKPHPSNPRNGDTDAIAESVRINGVYRPVITAADGTILAGHHLYHALGEFGYDTVTIIRLDVDPDSAEAHRIMLADNKTADLGNYDDGLLLKLLKLLEPTDEGITGTGFDLTMLAKLDGTFTEDYNRDSVDNRDPGDIKVGDRWRVGEHIVVCGDSSDAASWAGCPPIAAIVSDPPYGIDYDGSPHAKRAKINHDGGGTSALTAILAAYAHVPTEPGCVVYTFSGSGVDGVTVAQGLMGAGYARWGLVWVKDTQTLGRTDYQGKHEMLWYGWTEGAHPKVKDRTLTTVLEFSRPTVSKEHPTEKPVPLLGHVLLAHDLPLGSWVADPFAGSGSTGVAAARLGMNTYQVELDPAYARVCLARLTGETGLEAVRVTE